MSAFRGAFPAMATRQVAKMSKARDLVTRQEVRSMVKSSILSSMELKRYVVAFTGVATTTAGSITPVTQGIIQGDSLLSRDGDQIVVKHFDFRLVMSPGGAGTECMQRIIIFWDNQANSAQPAVTDVLNSASYITGYNPVVQQQNRFHILFDKFVQCVSTTVYAKHPIHYRVKLNHKVTFLDTTNVATASGKGAMYVLFISDNVNGVNNASFELHFTDA